MVKEVEGFPIPVDSRLHRNTTPSFTVSEPYLFDGLEFGFDARSHRFATAIYKAQEARHSATGILTAVSESHLDVAPYFIYSSVWGGGAPWAVMTFRGERLDSKRTTTTKVLSRGMRCLARTIPASWSRPSAPWATQSAASPRGFMRPTARRIPR